MLVEFWHHSYEYFRYFRPVERIGFKHGQWRRRQKTESIPAVPMFTFGTEGSDCEFPLFADRGNYALSSMNFPDRPVQSRAPGELC